MYYTTIENAALGAHKLVAPRSRGLQYAEHMGLEVREIFRAGRSDDGAEFGALLDRIKRRTEKHILLPDPRCLADIERLEALFQRTKRAGCVIHFFYWGVVLHRGSSIHDFLRARPPLWLIHISRAEAVLDRALREWD